MTTHTINATITVEITNLAMLAALGGGSEDERSQVDTAIHAGLRELPSIAQRYGFRITESSATVS